MTDWLRHDHLSGRFTATPAEEEAALDALMQRSDLVTTTEVDANLRARALREPGWTAVFGNKGSRDDCGIAMRDSRLHLIEGGTKTLSPLRYKTERGTLSDTTEGAYAVVQDLGREPRRGVVVVVHMPHGMQDDLRLGTVGSDVAKAYRDILKGARRLANRLTRKYRAAWTMIVGDWNLNIKHPWVAPYLALQFPRYTVNFAKPYPAKGTFGPEIIDLALLWGIGTSLLGPKILRRQPGFDHVAWAELLG